MLWPFSLSLISEGLGIRTLAAEQIALSESGVQTRMAWLPTRSLVRPLSAVQQEPEKKS